MREVVQGKSSPYPPTTRYLTAPSLKAFNSSSKSEFIGPARALGMRVNHHTPSRLQDRRGTKALPVFDVEGAVHIRKTTVAFHDKRLARRCCRRVHFFILPAPRSLLRFAYLAMPLLTPPASCHTGGIPYLRNYLRSTAPSGSSVTFTGAAGRSSVTFTGAAAANTQCVCLPRAICTSTGAATTA